MSLVYPMFVMVILTFLVALRLFWVRVKALLGGTLRLSYFRSLPDGVVSEDMAVVARHFVNLFEVPVLFFAACLTGIILGVQSETLLSAAWFFVLCRSVHALIHLTYNNVKHRFVAYLSGYLTVLFMWTVLVLPQ